MNKDYFEIDDLYRAGKINGDERMIRLRIADEKMISSLKAMGVLKGDEELYRQAGLRGIQSKNKFT